jgi:hypothetical protein
MSQVVDSIIAQWWNPFSPEGSHKRHLLLFSSNDPENLNIIQQM